MAVAPYPQLKLYDGQKHRASGCLNCYLKASTHLKTSCRQHERTKARQYKNSQLLNSTDQAAAVMVFA